MSATAAISGKGTTIGHSTTSGGSYSLFGEVKDCTPPEKSVGNFEATHYTSPSNTVEKVSTHWQDNTDSTFTLNYVGAMAATIDGLFDVAGWFKVTYPDNATDVFPGFISKLGKKVPNKEGITQEVTITVTGPMTYTVGS